MRRSFVLISAAMLAAPLCAQTTTLRVVGSDSVPIPYAWIAQSGLNNITGPDGRFTIGTGKHKSYSLEIRRIGYQPWSGTITSPDTASVATIVLQRIAQNLPGVAVNGSAAKHGLELDGFYSRWLEKQHGKYRDATFIGPEMIDKRNAVTTTDLLDHLIDVKIVVNAKGDRAVTGTGERPNGEIRSGGGRGSGNGGGNGGDRGGAGGDFGGSSGGGFGGDRNNVCYMTVLVDGGPVCPPIGCHYVFAGDPPGSSSDDHSLDLDKLVPLADVSGIEVYPRKDGMPDDIKKVYQGCGVIAIWTGGRK
jgi:hypothetical protein